MLSIIEKAPAKLNLGLDTPFTHSDGYPEWNMLMASIDLADYVEISSTNENQIKIITNSGFLPNDNRNLAYQAAKLIKNCFNIQLGVNIKIDKHIPVAAGMGGGSTDAAAVMRGLNKIWNLKLSTKQLIDLALEIDSDVPYCILGQTAWVKGKGNNINLLPSLPPTWFVIAKPQVSISTPEIIHNIDYDKLKHPNMDLLLNAAYKGNFDLIVKNMGNVLESISNQYCPQISNIKSHLLKSGAIGAQMSGTGPTVFAVCNQYHQAKRLVNSTYGFCPEVYLVRSL